MINYRNAMDVDTGEPADEIWWNFIDTIMPSEKHKNHNIHLDQSQFRCKRAIIGILMLVHLFRFNKEVDSRISVISSMHLTKNTF